MKAFFINIAILMFSIFLCGCETLSFSRSEKSLKNTRVVFQPELLGLLKTKGNYEPDKNRFRLTTARDAVYMYINTLKLELTPDSPYMGDDFELTYDGSKVATGSLVVDENHVVHYHVKALCTEDYDKVCRLSVRNSKISSIVFLTADDWCGGINNDLVREGSDSFSCKHSSSESFETFDTFDHNDYNPSEPESFDSPESDPGYYSPDDDGAEFLDGELDL